MRTTKTTLEMSDTLFRRAKAAAATRGQTLKELVTGAIERELRLNAPSRGRKSTAALRSVRQLAKANALRWRGSEDAVTAVREQRRG
jgi:hypothetical protein